MAKKTKKKVDKVEFPPTRVKRKYKKRAKVIKNVSKREQEIAETLRVMKEIAGSDLKESDKITLCALVIRHG